MTLQDIHAPAVTRESTRSNSTWLNTEEAKLKALYPTAPWSEIEAAIPRHTRMGIRERAQRLKLKRPQRKPPNLHWLIEAITIIRADQNLSVTALALKIGMDRGALSRALSAREGLPKTETLLRVIEALGHELVIRPKEQAAE